MPDNSLECHLGQLMAKTDRLLAEQEWQRERLEKLTVCKQAYDEMLPLVEARLDKLQHEIEEIRQYRWRFDGGATVAAWIGGLVLAGLITIGGYAMSWLFGAEGPLGR